MKTLMIISIILVIIAGIVTLLSLFHTLWTSWRDRNLPKPDEGGRVRMP